MPTEVPYGPSSLAGIAGIWQAPVRTASFVCGRSKNLIVTRSLCAPKRLALPANLGPIDPQRTYQSPETSFRRGPRSTRVTKDHFLTTLSCQMSFSHSRKSRFVPSKVIWMMSWTFPGLNLRFILHSLIF